MNRTDESVIDALHGTIDAARDDIISLTADLVTIPSVNPKFELEESINREGDVQDRLEIALEESGFKTEQIDVFPGRPNLFGSWPGSEKRSLILCGHVDVVPVGARSQWSVDPFGAEIKNNRLYGRGAIDMKSGLAACVMAANAIHSCGLELEGALRIHSVVDEEAGGFGAMDAVRRGRLAAAILVAEPTWGDVMPAEGGLEWVRVTIRGRSAHAGWRYNEIFPQHHGPGRLEPGVNAIELATRFIMALGEYEKGRTRRRSHPLVPAGLNTINPGVLQAGAGMGENGLPNIMTNPAMVPDIAVLDLDFKFLPDENSAQVRADFEHFVHHFAQTDAFLKDNEPTVRWELGGLHFPPLNTPPDHPLVASLVKRSTKLEHAPTVRGFEAVCDAAHYAGAGVEGVIFGASGDGFHGVDEYVDLDSLVDTTKTIAATIVDWCGLK